MDSKGTKTHLYLQLTIPPGGTYIAKHDNVKNHENEIVLLNKSQRVTQSVKEWCVVATVAWLWRLNQTAGMAGGLIVGAVRCSLFHGR